MISFSQRKGIKPIKSVMQVDSMDGDLRNGLWDMLALSYWKKIGGSHISMNKNLEILFNRLWHGHFKWPIDTLDNYWSSTYEITRRYFFKCNWNEVYDFVEFVANNYSVEHVNQEFMISCNSVLEREVSAYRFVGGKITEITSEEEISEIEEALKVPVDPVKEHLRCALEHLADRKNPDYRNSIKESISAVEAICRLIAGNNKATLGDALKEIERRDKANLHGALRSAFASLYGYTSDAEGIRHSLLDESTLDFEDAKFMLVSCSAFINYLLVKSSKAGIKLKS